MNTYGCRFPNIGALVLDATRGKQRVLGRSCNRTCWERSSIHHASAGSANAVPYTYIGSRTELEARLTISSSVHSKYDPG